MQVTIHHADHGITPAQQAHINQQVESNEGFFIQQVSIPADLGTVPCGLYGPVMGDEPVRDTAVTMETRGDRPYADRMIDQPMRQVDYVQVIGIKDGDKLSLFTVYGGALAPQHPEDPTNKDVEASNKFWSEHALAK